MGGSFKQSLLTMYFYQNPDGNMQITGCTTLSLLFSTKDSDRYLTTIILFIAVKKGVLYTSVKNFL